jgi:hypothetical protein
MGSGDACLCLLLGGSLVIVEVGSPVIVEVVLISRFKDR